MPKAKATPLSDNLLPIQKGAAMPAPEPGRQRRASPPQDRVSMTFRITSEAHEHLRRMAYEDKTSQQALVDEALELLVKHRSGSRTVARLHASMEG
jgi:hypothetical protein